MLVFASDLRNNGIPLIVGMYPCGDHWHINAIDVSDERNPVPLDVLLSAEKLPDESECCKRLAALIEHYDPMHEVVHTLVFQAYTVDRDHFSFIPPPPGYAAAARFWDRERDGRLN